MLACWSLDCPVVASVPSRPCRGLDVGPSRLGIGVRIADSALSSATPHRGPHRLGPARLRAPAGFTVMNFILQSPPAHARVGAKLHRQHCGDAQERY